jgi:phosphoadenosine phosphosulfate reductase
LANNKETLFPYDKIQEAIEFLRQNEPPEGYDVKFSGGKDSIVMYDIVKQSGVKHVTYYNFTTIDPPELTRFILKEYPEVKWLRPKKNFFQYVRQIGLPTITRRWCCTMLKHGIDDKRASIHKICGIRAEESRGRAERGRINVFKKGKKRIIYSPIFYFNEGDVWDYIDDRKLPYSSLYDEGFSRIGCVICPFACRKGVIEKYKNRWSNIYEIFERVVAECFEKDRKFYEDRGIFSAKEYLQLWYYNLPLPSIPDRTENLF